MKNYFKISFLSLLMVGLFSLPFFVFAEDPPCESDTWDCSEWTDCIYQQSNKGHHTRTCVKTFDCPSIEGEPETSQYCTPKPVITSISPNTIYPDTTVTITGNFGPHGYYSNWCPLCNLKINNLSTYFFQGSVSSGSIWTSTDITFKLPMNTTSGYITVVDVNGTESNQFNFTLTLLTPRCTSTDWSCGDWNSCSSNSIQTRACNKISNCEGGVQSPSLTQSCVYSEPSQNNSTSQSDDSFTIKIPAGRENGVKVGDKVYIESLASDSMIGSMFLNDKKIDTVTTYLSSFMVMYKIYFTQTVYFIVPESVKSGDLIIYNQNRESINIGRINIYEPPIDCSIYGNRAKYFEQTGECYCQWGYKWNSNKTSCVEKTVVTDNPVISNDTDGDGVPNDNDYYPNKISEIISKNYTFNYILLGDNRGKKIDIKVEVPKDLYLYYQNQNHVFSESFRNITSFVTSDDLVIKKIANQIEQLYKTQNFNPIAVAYQLVSQIVYTDDKFSIKGWDEYPKYPVETIVERSGDCEDTTFLMASLMKALNLASPLLVRFDDHLGLAAFAVDNKNGGKDIFYIETTGNGTNVPGVMPEALVGKKYTLHELDEYKRESYKGNIQNNITVDKSLSNRLKGKLLLQTEQKGKIWYVAPNDGKKHEVTFANALTLFEKLAVGITDANLNKIPLNTDKATSSLGNSSKGKLFLQVQQKGKIWYVDFNGKRWEVTWANLMDLFKSLALGITDSDLNKIQVGN